ncbi:hypothetical protein FOL47_001738, partial [Perkinsus chesapeaki]
LRYRMKTDPRRVADLGMVFSSVLVEWTGATLMAPITPWYVKKLAPNMGQGTAASILMASYNIGMFVTSLFTGPLSDRVGRRPLFLVALVLYTGAQFADANAWDLASLAGFRALEGVLAGTRPVIIAYLSDISENDDMKLYGVIMGIFVVVGQLIGPVIGGALLQVSLWLPFYFMGIVSGVLLLLEFLFLRESLVKDSSGKLVSKVKKAEEETFEYPKNRWLIPTVICLGIAAFCRQYVYLTWTTVFGLLGADRFHLSSSANGVVMGIQAAVAIVANIIYVPLTRIMVPARIGCIGQLMCVVVIAVPWIYNLYGAVILGMMVNIGGNLYFGGLAYFNAVISPPKKRGLINSLVIAMSNAGGICGPLLAGVLYDMSPVHHAYPFYMSTAMAIIGGVSCFGIDRGIKHALDLLAEMHVNKSKLEATPSLPSSPAFSSIKDASVPTASPMTSSCSQSNKLVACVA